MAKQTRMGRAQLQLGRGTSGDVPSIDPDHFGDPALHTCYQRESAAGTPSSGRIFSA
jgi:hypothetical protein